MLIDQTSQVVTVPADDYPPDWPEIALRIKRAARWRCEHCGELHNPKAGRTLTVHHLDGIKRNCHWRNLVALCQVCHLHIQARWKPGQPWLFNPPLWAVRRGYADEDGVPRMDGLTSVDLELMKAIKEVGGDGAAVSLFRVAVVHAGITYWWALYRLQVLEALGYVSVQRNGRGKPLVMRVTA